MKIVKIYGGLGNQMFQYAFALELEQRRGEPVYLDLSGFEDYGLHNGFELERVFGIQTRVAPPDIVRRLSVPSSGLVNRFRRKYLTKKTHFIDRYFGYYPAVFDREGDCYYDGYWQSEKYFVDVEEAVRRVFRFREGLGERNEALLQDLPGPRVSLHVRRGDYLKSENLNVCTPAYYEAALAELRASIPIRSILVFSDDISWCRENLQLEAQTTAYIDWNTGLESWRDMALMTRCDHHIIANSSFSWWGAWLNPRMSKRVFAPRPWNMREINNTDHYYSYSFSDIIPASWERVGI